MKIKLKNIDQELKEIENAVKPANRNFLSRKIHQFSLSLEKLLRFIFSKNHVWISKEEYTLSKIEKRFIILNLAHQNLINNIDKDSIPKFLKTNKKIINISNSMLTICGYLKDNIDEIKLNKIKEEINLFKGKLEAENYLYKSSPKKPENLIPSKETTILEIPEIKQKEAEIEEDFWEVQEENVENPIYDIEEEEAPKLEKFQIIQEETNESEEELKATLEILFLRINNEIIQEVNQYTPSKETLKKSNQTGAFLLNPEVVKDLERKESKLKKLNLAKENLEALKKYVLNDEIWQEKVLFEQIFPQIVAIYDSLDKPFPKTESQILKDLINQFFD